MLPGKLFRDLGDVFQWLAVWAVIGMLSVGGFVLYGLYRALRYFGVF